LPGGALALSGFFYGLLSNQVWEAYRIIMERAPKPPHAKVIDCFFSKEGGVRLRRSQAVLDPCTEYEAL